MRSFKSLILGAILVFGTSLPAYADTPLEVRFSNISNDGFSISWVTNSLEAGYVLCGTDPASLTIRADDDRGAGVAATTHHVTLVNLQESTRYYCDIHSGATVDNNGGAHYQITTGPLVDIILPAAVYGQASRADGSSPAGIMVYLTVRDGDGKGSSGGSALLSTIIKEGDQGYWYLNLGNARVESLNAPFAYSASGDKLELRFVGGPGQVTAVTLDTGAAAPAPTVTVPAASISPQATATPTAPSAASPTLTLTQTPSPQTTATPTVTPPGTPTLTDTPTGTPTVVKTATPPATSGFQTPVPPTTGPIFTPPTPSSPIAALQATATPTAISRPTPTPQPPLARTRTTMPTISPSTLPVQQAGGGEEGIGWLLIILGAGIILSLLIIRQRGRAA